MRTRLTVLAFGVFVLVSAWPSVPGPAVLPPIDIDGLIAEPVDRFTFVPPPAPTDPQFYGADAATFNVTYNGFGAFPAAQAAFQHAVDIWSGLITSPVTINVNAVFEPLGPDILGSAGAPLIRDWAGVPVANTWYGDPLADQLNGADLGGGAADINASFNSAFGDWYFGTDMMTPAGQWDFVSVVLHELGHGLNFFGSATVNGANGSWGYGTGFPAIYDRFVVTDTNVPMLTGFVSPSAPLGTQLQQPYNGGNPRGPGFYFSGTSGNAANGGLSARIETSPNGGPWIQGSSYSHLEDNTYPAGDPNSLMTWQIGSAEAIHNPGPVVLGMFADMGWTVPGCVPVLSPTSASYTRAGGNGTVDVTIGAGCAWTAVSNNSWITVTGGSSGTGSGTVSYSVAVRAGVNNRVGTITIAGATFTVNQTGKIVTLTPSTLNFAGTNNAGTLVPITPAQQVVVAFDASGTSTWSASANQPWVQLTGASAQTDSGSFMVEIINPGGVLPPNVLSGQAMLNATITLTSTNVNNSPQTVAVNLRLDPAGVYTGPIGLVDTPLQSQAGVVGAIGVTGWVVDDVGIAGVKVYRNCLTPWEPAINCNIVNGQNLVFVGDSTLVPGARPDVEALFPTYPQKNVAAWGYLMLTNMLPHVPNQALFGGQGTMTFYALATDIEGNVRQLGRTQFDTTPTTITLANDTITKPFGAIDTPGQGQTIGGAAFVNFGWSLTPDSNNMADGTDILVPTNGSTSLVYIDGAPVGNVSYNQCRGVAHSGAVTPGQYCDDDVANIFGNPTPQPPNQLRFSNPTRHRNLDAGRGAIGAYFLDTTAFSNGLHTILWGVTDSAARGEGIGSRFITILNGSTLTAQDLAVAPTIALASASELGTWPASGEMVWGRQGFGLSTPWEVLAPDAAGQRAVRIPTQGRLEVDLGAGALQAGYLAANGTLRALPPGSRLDKATGIFTWAPGPGYVGTYDLAFLRLDGTQVSLQVTLDPVAATTGHVEMALDRPGAGATVAGSFAVEGWALDTGAWQGVGVGTVHVWAQRTDAPGVPPVFLGSAELGGARPDVAAAYGAQFDQAGWGLTASGLDAGTYEVTAYVWSTRTQRFEDARTVSITVR